MPPPDFQPPRQLLLIPQQLQPPLAQPKTTMTSDSSVSLTACIQSFSKSNFFFFCTPEFVHVTVKCHQLPWLRPGGHERGPPPLSLQSGGVSPGRTVPPTAQGLSWLAGTQGWQRYSPSPALRARPGQPLAGGRSRGVLSRGLMGLSRAGRAAVWQTWAWRGQTPLWPGLGKAAAGWLSQPRLTHLASC